MKEVFVPTFSVKFCESHQSPALVQSRQEQTCFDLLRAVVAMGGVIAKVKMACGCRLTYFGSDSFTRTMQERARAESGSHDSPPEPRRSEKPYCSCGNRKGRHGEHDVTCRLRQPLLPGVTFTPKLRYEE